MPDNVFSPFAWKRCDGWAGVNLITRLMDVLKQLQTTALRIRTKTWLRATHTQAVTMGQMRFLEGHYRHNEPGTRTHEEKTCPVRPVSVSVFLPDKAYVHCKAVAIVSSPEYGICIYLNIVTVTVGLILQWYFARITLTETLSVRAVPANIQILLDTSILQFIALPLYYASFLVVSSIWRTHLLIHGSYVKITRSYVHPLNT